MHGRTDDPRTKNANLTTVGATCTVLTTVAFVIGIVLMASSGIQALIPETGKNGLDWIRDLDDAGGVFFAGGWLVVIDGITFVGFVGLFVWIAAMDSLSCTAARRPKTSPLRPCSASR